MVLGIPTLSKIRRHLKEPLYKNAFFLLLNSVLAGILGFVFWIVAARFYSPDEVGVVGALIAAIMLLSLFSRLGFDMGLIRFLPAAEDKAGMINSCLTITCIASLIMSLVFAAGLDFWSPALSFIREDISFLLSFIIFTVAISLSIMLNATFVAFRRAEFSLSQGTIGGLLRATLPFLTVAAGTFGLFLSWGLGASLAIAISLFLFLPKLQPKYRPLLGIKKRVVNDMIRFSFLNYASGILGGTPKLLLPLLIINILGSEITAYFRISWAISSVLFITIPFAICSSLYAEGSHNPDKLRKSAIRALFLMLGLVVPGIAIVLLFGDKILLLFGAAYAENGLAALRILALSSIPIIFIQLFLHVRIVQMRMKSVLLVEALAAVLILGIGYTSMSHFGLIGIAIGWTLAQALAALLIGVIILVQRRVRLRLGW